MHRTFIFIVALALITMGNLSATSPHAIGAELADEGIRFYTPIYEIQGAGTSSPLAGARTDTFGIVTGVAPRGFYLQDPLGDGSTQTSDGLFVFTGSPPTVDVGDCVAVLDALVSEFYGKTELSKIAKVEQSESCETVDLQPVALPPVELGADIAQRYEPFEGMLVEIGALDGIVHGATKRYASGEAEIAWLPVHLQPAVKYGRLLREDQLQDDHPGVWVGDSLQYLSSLVGAELPDVKVGDRILHGAGAEPLRAILDYNFGKYQILPLPGAELKVEDTERTQEFVSPVSEDSFTICAYNVHGLGRGTEQFADLDQYVQALQEHASVIAEALQGCTIVALQETGIPADAVALADVLRGKYGYEYEAVAITGPGTFNREFPLTNSFLVRTERVEVLNVTMVQGCSSTDYQVREMESEPCPDGQFALFNRPPLVMDVQVRGDWDERYELRLIDNHWKSKAGDENVNEKRRLLQAQHVASLSDNWLRGGEERRIVVLGDLNDFGSSEPLSALVSGAEYPLVNALSFLPENDQYTFNFNGVSQVLDHILLSESMVQSLSDVDVVHRNVDFPHCGPTSDARQCQESDHDPVVVRIKPEGATNIGGELGYQGIVVTLTHERSGEVRQATTGVEGAYRLWDVTPGEWTLSYQAPEWLTVGPPQLSITVESGYTDVPAPYVQLKPAALAAEAATSLIDAAIEKR